MNALLLHVGLPQKGLENLKQWLRTYRFHARFYLLSMALKQFRLR